MHYFDNKYHSVLTLVAAAVKKPRYYQANMENALYGFLLEGMTRICIKSPTGTGKTLMSQIITLSSRIRGLLGVSDDKPLRVLYIAHKNRLLRQATNIFKDLSGVVEIIAQSAMSSIPDKIIEEGFDICIVDECHHEAMTSIQLKLETLKNTPIIGFTAEDLRADGLILKFERTYVAITEKEAALNGFTSPAGINSIVEMDKRDKSKLTCDILSNYHHCMGNTIIFMSTEKELKVVKKHLDKIGVKSSIIGSGTNEKTLDYELDRLSEGKIQFLLNCQKIGEGVDSKNITDVFLARSFNSFGEKKQYAGRAIRPDSPCTIWEFVNPLKSTISAKSVVGLTRFERLISFESGAWNDRMLSGEDPTWGKMSELRHNENFISSHLDVLKAA